MGGPGSEGPMAGQGCVELETSPAGASLGQGLMAPGADMEFWAVGSPGELGRDRQGWWCHQGPGTCVGSQ